MNKTLLLFLLAICAAACSRDAATDSASHPAKPALAAPFGPIHQVAWTGEERMTTPAHYLFDQEMALQYWAPYHPGFVREHRIAEIDQRQYNQLDNPAIRPDSPEQGLRMNWRHVFGFDARGFCVSVLFEAFDKNGKVEVRDRKHVGCDAEGKPRWMASFHKVGWAGLIGDTARWDTTRFGYDAKGRLTTIMGPQFGDRAGFTDIWYDDTRGLALFMCSSDDRLPWLIEVVEVPGALTDSLRLRMGQAILRQYRHLHPSGTGGKPLSEIAFLETDGRQVFAKREVDSSGIKDFGPREFDQKGRITQNGFLDDMSMYCYDDAGNLVREYVQQQVASIPLDRLLTYTMKYDDEGLLMEKTYLEERFDRADQDYFDIDKEFLSYKRRGE